MSYGKCNILWVHTIQLPPKIISGKIRTLSKAQKESQTWEWE